MLLNLCKNCRLNNRLIVRSLNLRSDRTFFGFGKKPKQKAIEPLPSHELEVEENVMTEEEVMKIRDKSRLPPIVRSEQTLENIPKMKFLWNYRKENVKRFYATYGKASGLKPGVMWPSREELEYIKGYEKAFHKPLHEMLDNINAEKESQRQKIESREKEISKNLKLLPKWKKEFRDKYNSMNREVEAEKLKKEKLIQEVREFVGYDLDPKDPRFEEALIKKDEETKRLAKTQRKQELKKQTLERLQALAAEAMEREKEDQTIREKSKSDPQKDSVETKSTDNSNENK